MGRSLALSILVSLVVLLLACSSRVATESGSRETPSSSDIRAPALGKEPWQAEWERVTKEARKEGKVVVFTSAGAEQRAALTKILRDRYGLELEMISGRGVELYNRLFTERRAGIFSVDVNMGGPGPLINELKPARILENLEPQLLLPEVLEPKAWWNGEIPFIDKDRQILALSAYPLISYITNTNLVKDEDIRSYWDLLNPKWKGKIIMDDPTVSGTGQGTFVVLSYVLLNLDFYRQLAKMEPTITRDRRQLVEWVAKGKLAIGFSPLSETFTEFKMGGAPIKGIVPVEGTYVSSGSGTISLISKAPHPNAARVFINWLLTKEGGTLYSEATGRQSAREDVPTSHLDRLDPVTVRQPGVKYFKHFDEEFLKLVPERVKVATEIFGPLMGKQ